MRDGGEGALPPADDPVVDLEPAADLVLDHTTGPLLEGVAGEWLPDGRHPADRQILRPARGGVSPGIAEVGDDDVAGPSHRAKVQLDLAVQQQPAAIRAGPIE